MPHRGRHKSFCKVCGRHVEECGPLSLRQKCAECGLGKLALNDLQLHEHNGPFFEHWRRQCLAAFGVVLPDEPPPPR